MEINRFETVLYDAVQSIKIIKGSTAKRCFISKICYPHRMGRTYSPHIRFLNNNIAGMQITMIDLDLDTGMQRFKNLFENSFNYRNIDFSLKD